MAITRLDDVIINRIAAGEVVERPASAVKELVENALDAGATRIEVATANGGKSLIRIIDNGHGMDAQDLALAVSRHCTSKMEGGLDAIATLGFRGEALPSIGSVSRMSLRSRPADGPGFEISVTGGVAEGPRPAACNGGTVVEVRDLFFATPARLKFMKSDRAENSAITDVIRRIAMAAPAVGFVVSGPDRQMLDFRATSADQDGRRARIAQILGDDFIASSVAVNGVREGVGLTGLVSLPAHNRANAQQQFVFVNGRPVRDKQLLGALRAAYSDMLARDRHAVAALFIEIDPADVDVNVHPAKAEVRFRDPGLVRALIIRTIRDALAGEPLRPASSAGEAMRAAFAPGRGFGNLRPGADLAPGYQAPVTPTGNAAASPSSGFAEFDQTGFAPSARMPSDPLQHDVGGTDTAGHLGAARAQIMNTYIVAQSADGLILVDQHAAHERIVLETLKQALHGRETLPAQMLLVPEIVDLPADDVDRLAEAAPALEQLGLMLEPFGPGAIAVRGTPAMLGQCDAAGLVRDLADDLAEAGSADRLRDAIERVASSMACHGSVRAGRAMRGEEMNALLRQMEATPGAGTCNHGRPTFIELKTGDIERLFGRR